MRDPKLTFLIRCAYGAVWLALIWQMVRYVLVWLLPFLIALALAALLEPAVVLCRRRLHLRRGFTATVLSLVVLGTVAAGLVLLATALPQAVLFCATTLLAVLFTAGSYPRIRAFLRRQLPEDRLRQARGVKADLLATLGKWCKAQCILLGVTFCELLAGLLLMRQGYALLLAALIAVIDALPVFGTGTVLVPWGALCLLTGNVPKGLGLLALYGVISLVRSVLEPKIMAAQVDLSPLAALAAMYVGFCAFGVAGMVLCPMALLFVKQLHDSGWLRLWK